MATLEKNKAPGPHARDWAAGYLQVRREVLARIINAFALLTPPVLLLGVVKLLPQQRWWIIAIYLVLFVLTLLAVAVKKRVPFEHMAVSVLCALYLFGVMLLAAFGTSGAGIEFLLAFTLLATILLGRKAGLVATILSVSGIAAIGAALVNGWIPISLKTMTNSTTGLTWAVAVCLFILLAAVLIFAQNTLITNLQRSLTQLGLQTRDLEETNMMLRLEVMERRRAQEELEKANILLQAESAERRQAYRALENSEVFNSAVVDNSPLGISVRAPDGTLLQYNAAWQRIWAMSEERIQDEMSRQRNALQFDERDDYLGEWQPRVREIYHHGGTLHIPPIRTGGKRAGMAEWVEHVGRKMVWQMLQHGLANYENNVAEHD